MKNPFLEVRKNSSLFTGDSLIDIWKRDLTKVEKDKIADILFLFELDKIYSTDSSPTQTSFL